MNLVLTMAGSYQRFAHEGFNIPKYLLPWGCQTLLSMILSELNKSKVFKEIFLVANHRDEAYMPHVRAVMRAHEIGLSNLIMTGDTTGQVETAMIGVAAVENAAGPANQPIIFHNIDTLLLGRDLSELRASLEIHSGFIDVFSANNKDYSYVLVDSKNRVTEIAEKIVVSDLATSGLYAFQSSELFRRYATPQDVFVSSVFKRMIESGLSVMASSKHKESDTIVLSTPSDFMNASLALL